MRSRLQPLDGDVNMPLVRSSLGVVVVLLLFAACRGAGDTRSSASHHGETITCVDGTRVKQMPGSLYCERPNGRRHGRYIEWSRDRATQRWYKALEGVYVEDRQQGVWTQYYETGAKYGEGPVKDGRKHGTWQHWDPNGTLVDAEVHVEGTLQSRKTYVASDVVETKSWETLDGGISVEHTEVSGGAAAGRTIVVTRPGGQMTYHERPDGELIKVERIRNGERVHITECSAGKPTATYWIAGNDTPDNPRYHVTAEPATASPCVRAQPE